MRRYALLGDPRDRISDILPGREGHVGGTAEDNRLFVRDLPERFGGKTRAGAISPSTANAISLSVSSTSSNISGVAVLLPGGDFLDERFVADAAIEVG